MISVTDRNWSSPENRPSAQRLGQGIPKHSVRRTLHLSKLVHLERATIAPAAPDPSGYEPRHQIALTYDGLFAYNVGRRRWLLDANSALFISPGWEFFEDHPVTGVGHSALLINPSRELLDELSGGRGPNAIGPFMNVTAPASMRLRMLLNHILLLSGEESDPLHFEERITHALLEAFRTARNDSRPHSRVVNRAKELLHASSSERMNLDELAAQVGVTPVYLTQQFTRCEGVPLYRYLLRLRLARSLIELPHCNDITGLALDLGFSSHSHFTSVFRNSFGITPSGYRSQAGSSRFRLRERGAHNTTRRAA